MEKQYDETAMKLMGGGLFTDFTKTTHRDVYPAIDPSRPELSFAGKTILITGGSTGIGFAIAQGFIKAYAATVIIIARRGNVVAEACVALKEEAKQTGKPTYIIGQSCDVTDAKAVEAFWNDLKDKGVAVDVLVLNAAKFTEPKPLLDLGADEVWSQFEANVKGPLYMTDKFSKQNEGRPKSLVNITTGTTHLARDEYMPGSAVRPAYALTKAAGHLFVQLVAKDVEPEKFQIVAIHPGMIYASGWEPMGITKDMLPFDAVALPGSFAVWAASKEARFLHGRYVWAAWDVDELATGEIRERIEGDFEFLRWGIHGLRGANRDKGWKG